MIMINDQDDYVPPLKLDCFTWDEPPLASEAADTLQATGSVATVALLAWEPGDEPKDELLTDQELSTEPNSLQVAPVKEPPLQPATAGRPAKPLDMKLIEQFASVGMPVKQIARFFNVTSQTLYTRAGELLMACKTKYEYDIWQKQKELADAGDYRILVHLGKTMLRQSEAIPTETTEEGEVEWTIKAPKAVKPKALTQDEREELEGE